jgi:UDP-N-acetylmuramoyl-L-alanyl-D-glutamate--2,6-diaminopimelate ligase
MGTVETRIGAERFPVTRTTPESIDVQRMLARMRDAGVRGIAMEVSSHGLELGRVAGTSFACGTFTNLTQDHLDFHGTMEEYFKAKALLFDGSLARRAAINLDDEYARRLRATCSLPTITFAVSDDTADVRPVRVSMSRTGSDVRAVTPAGEIDVRVPIAGRYNVSNAMAALATCISVDIAPDVAAAGIAGLPGVPGRLEAIDAGQPFTVLVDYAHTPDSLEGVLRAAREVSERRLIVVFGCGGDRDRGKRPLMGGIAVRFADRTIITSDNPRSEDPAAIVREIEEGARSVSEAASYEIEVDRRLAIRRAIEGAEPGDVVVIAGKGHETGQQFADRTIPFDDRIVAREELERCFR